MSLVTKGKWTFTKKTQKNLKLLEKEIDLLRTLGFEIYEDNDENRVTDVVIAVLAAKVSIVEIKEIEMEIVEGSGYQFFITEISSIGLDEIEKS